MNLLRQLHNACFYTLRIPDQLYDIVVAMTTNINSNDLSSKFSVVLNLAQTAGYLTGDEVAEINAVVNENLNWQALNYNDIENWLNENAPTPAPSETPTETTTETPQTGTTPTQVPTTTAHIETTTLGSNGSSSLIASFIILALCGLGKLLI